MYKIELITPTLAMSDFTFFQIHKSIYQLANSAVFVASNKDYADLEELKRIIKTGLPVQVKIDDELALSGFIAEPKPGYIEKKPAMTIKVNSKASILCGASVGRGRYYLNQPFFAIAQELAAGSGVKVVNLSRNQEIIPEFVTYAGDDIDVVLNRLARLTNTYIYSDAGGQLVIADKAQKSLTTSALVTGENICDIHYFENSYNDFSEVALHSQQPLNDELSLTEIINNSLLGISKGNNRQKHKTVDQLTSSLLDSFIRELEEESFDFKVSGSSLKDTDGHLLEVNHGIRVKDSWLGLNDSFLATELTLKGGDKGYSAILNLEEFSHE